MKIALDDDQFKAFSNIMTDISQVVFGFSVVPIIFDFDNIKQFVLLSGLIITFGCWSLSIIFAKRRIT